MDSLRKRRVQAGARTRHRIVEEAARARNLAEELLNVVKVNAFGGQISPVREAGRTRFRLIFWEERVLVVLLPRGSDTSCCAIRGYAEEVLKSLLPVPGDRAST